MSLVLEAVPVTRQPDPVCPSCGARSRDWLLCGKCTGQLRGALMQIAPALSLRSETGGGRQSLPWEDQSGDWTGLDDQLTASLARLGSRSARAGGRSTSQPLPLDSGASAAIADLRNTLGTWVRALIGPSDCRCSPPVMPCEAWPRDSLQAMAAWMLDRMRRIRSHVAAEEIKRDICRDVWRAMRVIDAPASQEFLGKCEVCGKGDVYAAPGSDSATCRACEAVVCNARGRRADLLGRAEQRLATKREMLSLLPTMYGVSLTDTRFRKWTSRGKLEPQSADEETGLPLYRVADVLDLANGERARGSERIEA